MRCRLAACLPEHPCVPNDMLRCAQPCVATFASWSGPPPSRVTQVQCTVAYCTVLRRIRLYFSTLPVLPVPQAYLEEELGDVEEYLSKQPPMRHFFPFSLAVRQWDMGSDFLWECKKVGGSWGAWAKHWREAGRQMDGAG